MAASQADRGFRGKLIIDARTGRSNTLVSVRRRLVSASVPVVPTSLPGGIVPCRFVPPPAASAHRTPRDTEAAAADVAALRKRLADELKKLPRVSGGDGAGRVVPTLRVVDLINRAEAEAKKRGDQFVAVQHVLLALPDDRRAADLLRDAGVS